MVTRARIYEKEVEIADAANQTPPDWYRVNKLNGELRLLQIQSLKEDIKLLNIHYVELMEQGNKTELQSIGRLLRKKQIKLEGVL